MDLSREIRCAAAGVAIWLTLGVVAQAGPVPQMIPFSNRFDYAAGTTVKSLTIDGWDASSLLVVVQTNVVWADASAVELPQNTTLSNAVTPGGATNVWTDFQVCLEPRLDVTDDAVQSNASIQVNLVDSGYLQTYDRLNGWLTLSNTAWGSALTALTNGQWARITLCQNYVSHQSALFLDGTLIKERLPFISNVTSCARFRMDGGGTTSSYFDNFGMDRTMPGGLPNNWDGAGLTDAQEIDAYGYLAFTFNVGPSQAYTTIQAAVNAALDRYTINVTPGIYTEDVSIAHSLAGLTGGVVTVNGSLSIGAGAVVGASGLACSNLTVANAGNLTVSGSLTAVSNVAVAAGGRLTVNGALVASHLTIGSGGRVVITNGSLQADGFTLTGSFSLDERWGNMQARSTLTFQDDFEIYPAGMPLSVAGFRGWGASDSSVVVEQTRSYGVDKAVDLGYGRTLSNRVSSGTATQVWTDLRAVMCYAADDDPTEVRSNASVMMVTTTNGYVSLYNRTSGTWDVCRRDAWGNALAPLTNGQWIRISVMNDFASKQSAIFLDGVLVRQQFPFINTNLTSYSTFSMANEQTNAACLDEVYIGGQYPPTLTNDVNGNLVPDAQEIALTGDIFPHGSVFKFR